MSLVIGINGVEKNIGVTSISLLLGQGFSDITSKKVAIIDFDTEYPEMKTILEFDSTNNYNIDNIMTYATMEDANLEPVIKSNITELLNTSVHVIYGTNFEGKRFNDVQITNLIKSLKEMYDFIILDLGATVPSQSLIDNIDLVLQVCIPSQKFIRALKQNKYVFNNKIEYVLNMYSKGLSIEKHFKKYLSKEFFARLSYSKEVRENLNKGYLDLESGTFRENLYELIYKILEKFSLQDLVTSRFLFANGFKNSSRNIIDKIWGRKEKEEENELRVKSPFARNLNNSKLGEILLSNGFITKEQLEMALKIQDSISG